MKFRTLIFFLGVFFPASFGLLMLEAQDAAQTELPSAPSSSKQESRSQKPVTPAPEESATAGRPRSHPDSS